MFVHDKEMAMKVKDAMHKGVEWVSPETPLVEVAKRMKKLDIGSIPVGENDKLTGMITDRDIVLRCVASNGDLSKSFARDAMSKGIHCCKASDDIDTAIKKMSEYKVRRLPVIDDNKRMVGMLAWGDISHAATAKASGELVSAVSAHH